MPLCCRCFGFYLGNLFNIIFVSIGKFQINLKFYITLCLISLIDVVLNVFLDIHTGNIIRFTVGLLMSTVFVATLNFILKKITKGDV